MISYRNKEYTSEQLLCQAYQYSYRDFMQLKEQGMALPDIMVQLAPTNSRVIAYDGIVYSNLTDFCNSKGLDYYRFRSKFKSTGSMEKAIEHAKTPSVARGQIVIDGETYHSYVELCKKHDLSYASFMNYVHSQNMSPEEAFHACKNARSKSITIQYNGKEYPSILSLCRKHGWNYSLMSKCLREGITVEEAAEKCESEKDKETKPIQTVEYKGETYRSLHALARIKGLTYSALFTMISGGWDLEAAVDELTYRRDHKKKSEKVLRNTQPVTIQGKTYPTIKQALKENHINTTSYYARKAAHPEKTPEEILGELLDPDKYKRRVRNWNKIFSIQGKTYGTQQEVFRAFQLVPAAVAAVMRTEKLEFEEAVELILERRSRGETNPDGSCLGEEAIVINNRRFESPREVVVTYGLKDEDIAAYMNDHGCREREAIRALAKAVVPQPADHRIYIVGEKTFQNKRSVYEYYGVSAYAVSQCMSRYNLSFEEAVLMLHENSGQIADDLKETEKHENQVNKTPLLSYEVAGKSYPNKQAVLSAYNLSRYEVCSYMRKHTVSFEDAILVLSEEKQKSANN